MAKKSMAKCLADNDFESALERLETTTGRWISEWYEVCETIFNRCKEWAKKYFLDPIGKTIGRLVDGKSIFSKLRKDDIELSNTCFIENNENNVEKCYLIEFFDSDNNSICSKVGTTSRTVQERIREELNSETYKDMGAVKCLIHRVYNCGDYPAEGLESYFRAKYIKKYPDSFHKNDRFIKQTFDYAEADRICAEYFA